MGESPCVLDVPLGRILISGNNPRQHFDDENLRQLGENIKVHGQIQNILVRPKGDDYELIVGERRVRACALVGIPRIRAEVRSLDDAAAYELKLIENVHREDLSDAEKGDAVYQLWAFDKYGTIKEVCESIQIPYDTVKDGWLPKARKLSPKLKELTSIGGSATASFSDFHAKQVLKYSHMVQDKLAKVSVERKLTSRQLQGLTRLYDEDPEADLNQLVDKILDIKKVEIPAALLTEEQKKMLKEAKTNKPKKPRTKPSKPKKKNEIKNPKPFKFKKVVDPHVAQATGEDEWYTPRDYIEAARLTMGSIDVDPASNGAANQIINAEKYYTKEEDGLKQNWSGKIWMNPPYSQPLITQFCNRLVEKYLEGEVKQACVLVNNATETNFYQNMLNHCKAVCFIKGRVKFIDKNGDATGTPLQGQTILYFGEAPRIFAENFSYFGRVLYALN